MGKTYSKAMIELVYEIRRRVESELKPSIKFANPNLLTELLIYYRSCSDAILCALIKELMVHAGSEWENRLKNQEQDLPAQQVKVYRGSVSIEEAPTNEIKKNKAKPELIYRGRVVKR